MCAEHKEGETQQTHLMSGSVRILLLSITADVGSPAGGNSSVITANEPRDMAVSGIAGTCLSGCPIQFKHFKCVFFVVVGFILCCCNEPRDMVVTIIANTWLPLPSIQTTRHLFEFGFVFCNGCGWHLVASYGLKLDLICVLFRFMLFCSVSLFALHLI